MEKLKSVTFPSRGSHPAQLEGVLHLLDGEGKWPAAVVCHPHPLGGGTMHSGVVSAIAGALAARGVMALRFNFRGVGRSGGQHDNGRSEQLDVAGALDWLLTQSETDPSRVSVVGYSFGAWVGLAHAQTDTRVAATAAVALAAWHYDTEFYQASARPGGEVEAWQFDPGFMQSFARPKFFVTGADDSLAPPQALHSLVDRLPPPKALHVLPDTDHFFRGCERELAELVAEFIAQL